MRTNPEIIIDDEGEGSSSLRINLHRGMLRKDDEVPGAIPNKFFVHDISDATRFQLSVDVGTRVLTHQLKAIPRSLDYIERERNYLLIGGTGTGKTYYFGGLITEMRRLWPERFNGTILVVTKSSIVLQTTDVLVNVFKHKNVLVLSYDALRASVGDIYMEWKTEVVNSQPVLRPVWYKSDETGVCAIICDEVQALKNEDSQT